MKSSKLGKKIKYYREENNLTQQQLADKIGVTWEMVSRYERGINEPYNRIDSISKVLNVSVGDLLQNDNNANSINLIPLFTKIPKDFSVENTTFFYTCPQWIYSKDKGVFALSSNLISDKEEGVYYISIRTKPQEGNLVLYSKGKELCIGDFENQKNILGIVLAKESKLI
jgi:transcriptional regulator with XRE-family HTH domain